MSNIRLNFSNARIVDITECEWKDLRIVIHQMERDGTESIPEGFAEASYGCVHIGPQPQEQPGQIAGTPAAQEQKPANCHPGCGSPYWGNSHHPDCERGQWEREHEDDAPSAQSRRKGHSALRWNKESKVLETFDPHPPAAPAQPISYEGRKFERTGIREIPRKGQWFLGEIANHAQIEPPLPILATDEWPGANREILREIPDKADTLAEQRESGKDAEALAKKITEVLVKFLVNPQFHPELFEKEVLAVLRGEYGKEGK